MSLTSYELFNIWFPALVGALAITVFWDFVRRRFWLFVSKFYPGTLTEDLVGLDSRNQSRAKVENHHREKSKKLIKVARGMNLLVSPKLSNSSATTAFDVEAQTGINPHFTPAIHKTRTSVVERTYSISTTITFTAFFPDGTPENEIRRAKKLCKRHAIELTRQMKSSVILQASIVIDPWVLAEIVELAKHCMQIENRCTFQLGNWAILYHDAGKVQLHLLKEGDVPVNVEARWQDGKTGITMRGLYLNGSQVKVGTKKTNKILRSVGPATQGAGDLDEFHLPTKESYVPREDSLIYASKVVLVDGVSLIVRSEASFILPPRKKNILIEAVWTRWLRISNSAKKMLLSLLFGVEDCNPERAANRPELEFDLKQLELSVEHWKGSSEIELLNTRKEVLLHLQEQTASGTIERAGPPSPHSHSIFVRDEHYLEYWQEGLRVLNEVIRRSPNDSHSHTHIRVRGGIQFLLGDFESALKDYDLAHLNTGAHQSTVLLERALVKCKLGRYSEAIQDVVAVITLQPNVNDIQELRACIQQILDQQRSFRIVTQSGFSCQRPLLPDQEKAMVKIPDLLTGGEYHPGEIESLRPISDAGTTGESVGLARAAEWSMTSIAKALNLQLKLTNYAQSLGTKPRYHVRRISFVSNILRDECYPDDVIKLLSKEDQELLNWQAPTEDLQDDFKVRNDLFCLSERLCPYKNFLLSLCDNVTADDGHEQRRGPLPLSSYRYVSYRSAMLTKHSAADEDVQTLFLYDGTPGDRSCWRRRSQDYIKLLVLPEARSPYRAFWLVQWDVLDLWHVVQGNPDRGLYSNPAVVERQDDLRKFHSFRSPWIAEVAAAGSSSPTSDGNRLNWHRGSDARTNRRMSIAVNEKPQTSRQTQSLRVHSAFPTISERFTCGGDSTVDSSPMNAYEWKSVDNFHYHNGDEEAVSKVLRSSDTHRIPEEWNQKDEIQELEIENGLQVAVNRGSYHDLRRSIIEQESAVLAGPPHPNICKNFNVLSSFQNRGSAADLMEHDLRSIIDSRLKGLPEGSTPFTLPETVDLILQIGEGMASSHGHNVTHRDLKWPYILCKPLHTLAESGSAFRPEHYYWVKIAHHGVDTSPIQSSDGETLVAGASHYKAPEMLEVHEFPLKVDVYSFGKICYEILTGKLPFEEYRPHGLSLHARGPLDNNPLLRDVPEALKNLIHQCLNSNPALRPTFDHIVMKLRECKVQFEVEKPGIGPVPRISCSDMVS